MDWQQLLTAQGGWGFAVLISGTVARLVLKGDLVLKREYEGVVKRADVATIEAKEAVHQQGSLSAQTIATQAELIKHLRKEGDE
jgi:hypothetical protein